MNAAPVENERGILAALDRARTARAQGPAWLGSWRAAALEKFKGRGFPDQRDESWRWTSLEPLLDIPFSVSLKPGRISPAQAEKAVGHGFSNRIVFTDGFFSPELSRLPIGIEAVPLSEGLKNGAADRLENFLGFGAWGGSLVDLNAAAFDDGIFLRIPKNAAAPDPIHAVFLRSARAEPSAAFPRIVIDAQSGSRARIIEEAAVLGGGPSWRNSVVDIRVGPDAAVDYALLQRGEAGVFETTALRATLAAGARFGAWTMTFGQGFARNDAEIILDGEGAQCALNGLSMVGERGHVDNCVTIDHRAPRCVSREIYKGVVEAEARAAFRGLVIVAPGAQKSSASVHNKNLLLSERGWVNSKPEFRIHANDVQCRHGSTIGQISQEALFYLRSRGVGREEAARMLVKAFAAEIAESAPEAMRPAFSMAAD
ncbi:MAG: Fe-S cluster assembly protein SufD [Elusimicrobiota bacterium]